VPTRIPASERTSQTLEELRLTGVIVVEAGLEDDPFCPSATVDVAPREGSAGIWIVRYVMSRASVIVAIRATSIGRIKARARPCGSSWPSCIAILAVTTIHVTRDAADALALSDRLGA
jgi:hypothetical protein